MPRRYARHTRRGPIPGAAPGAPRDERSGRLDTPETAGEPTCESTGARAVAGECPEHGGDACLVRLPADLDPLAI